MQIFLNFKTIKKGVNVYLLAEEAVDQKNEDTLKTIDDGEEVAHDLFSWAHLQDAQTPCAAKDENQGCGFQCQHPEGSKNEHVHMVMDMDTLIE